MIKKSFSGIPLALLMGALIGMTCLLMIIVVILTVKLESDALAIKSAQTAFTQTANSVLAKINTDLEAIHIIVSMAALYFRGSTVMQDNSDDTLQIMRTILQQHPILMSAYVGYDDGSFHQLIAIRDDPLLLETYQAPQDTVYISRIIPKAVDAQHLESWYFLDASMQVLTLRESKTEPVFDPRQRSWYIKAMQSHEHPVYTPPYVFSSSRLPGITSANRLYDGSGVFGVDVTLLQISELVSTWQEFQQGLMWVSSHDHHIIAYPGLHWSSVAGDDLSLPLATDFDQPLVREVAHRYRDDIHAVSANEPIFLYVDSKSYMLSITSVLARHGMNMSLIIAVPLKDITGHIHHMALRIALFASAALLVILIISVSLGMRASRAVTQLAQEAQKIRHFDFSTSPKIFSSIKEVKELALASECMKNAIKDKTNSLLQTQKNLELVVQGGLALSAEKELAKLVTLIFQTTCELAQADGGVLYLLEGDTLEVEILSLGKQNLVLGGLSEHPAPRVMVRPGIVDFLCPDSVLRYACESFNKRDVITVHDANLSLFPTGLPEEPKNYVIHAMIAVPIITRRNEILGVIQVFNPKACEHAKKVGDQAPDVTGFMRSLAAQAAVTLDNRNLVNSLRDLFDALVQVIAASIDAKSTYTGGHCIRVPIITEMLAKAAHETTQGPLKAFRLDSNEAWRQLWIASWLHDCGKVAIPEYVVDKATRLETMYDRIHEIRTRFEILHRDAWIDYYHSLLEKKGDAESLGVTLETRLQELEQDFAFIARCNSGDYFMSEADKQRLSRIATRTWIRHYSDRLGISDAEARRKNMLPEPALPTVEYLLADKPEHLFERRRDYAHLKDIDGHPIHVPILEYNRGELYNLSTERGTLTAEERFKINEHMLIGLEMLKRIPFPEQLARVVEIASGHHETLIGTGYPLRKRKEHLSVEARILAIADVFEALTAADRPYKKPRQLSDTLRIMAHMRDAQYIDADLFDLFLLQGVFRQYAKVYLDLALDDVNDIRAYLSPNALANMEKHTDSTMNAFEDC